MSYVKVGENGMVIWEHIDLDKNLDELSDKISAEWNYSEICKKRVKSWVEFIEKVLDDENSEYEDILRTICEESTRTIFNDLFSFIRARKYIKMYEDMRNDIYNHKSVVKKVVSERKDLPNVIYENK